MKEKILRRFGLKDHEGAIVKIWAFNQGFYNLFLALGLFYALYLIQLANNSSGILLAQFILLTIFGAGLVLLISAPKKYTAALIQAVPAALGFIASLFL